MSVSGEHTVSLWMNTEVAPGAPALRSDETADIAVIGSGSAGLSTAFELMLRGKNVVVLDRGPIGMGMTSRTTAHLVAINDDGNDAFIKLRGLDLAKTYYESQSAPVDRIEQIQSSEKIACNFRRLDGFLFPAIGSDPAELDPEFDAARRVGVAVERDQGVPFKGQEKVRCLRYPNLVVVTNSPINDRVAIHTKQAPYRTYAMAFTIPPGIILDGLHWDTLDPYHYVQLQPGPGTTDYLIVGDADHKTGEADDAWVRFEGSAWEELYDPSRKTNSAIKNFITENVTTVKNFAEYVAPGELKSTEELKPGQGAIIRADLAKIAAYRDEDGILPCCSAVCTHVACHMHWNSLEVCWDCPRHGSHFAVDGTALNASAVAALAPAAPEKTKGKTPASESV